MPHYDFMNVTGMSEADAALLRARLHLIGGKKRLEEGLSVAGIAALYDALLFGMRYYISGSERCARINVAESNLWDHGAMFYTLVRTGVFDDLNAFNRLSLTVEQALWQETYSFDTNAVQLEIEGMLTHLGILPFDESTLPI